MKTYLDCYACFIRQALEATRIAKQEETVQKRVLNEVMERLKTMDLDASPPRQAQSDGFSRPFCKRAGYAPSFMCLPVLRIG